MRLTIAGNINFSKAIKGFLFGVENAKIGW